MIQAVSSRGKQATAMWRCWVLARLSPKQLNHWCTAVPLPQDVHNLNVCFSKIRRNFKLRSFPVSSVGKESTCNVRDLASVPGLGRSPGEGRGYPLQYPGLENSMDGMVHGVAKSQTCLSDFYFHLKSGIYRIALKYSRQWLFYPQLPSHFNRE